MKTARLLPLLLLALAATPAFAGLTYDAVNDFSTASNPNGVWSYAHAAALGVGGYLDVGAITLLPTSLDSGSLHARTDNSINLRYPHVLSSDTTFTSGTVTYNDDALTLHPALIAGSATQDLVLVRWTAPITALYSLSYEFFTQDTSTLGDGVLVNPVLNIGQAGEFVPSPVLLDPAGTTTTGPIFFPSLLFNAGDTVDFTVWRGTDAGQDSTGLRATFYTEAPEPGTYALVACGLLGLAFLRRRRTS